MPYLKSFSIQEDTLEQIQNWRYGINWPVVYIYYNETHAYVGESLDAARRYFQHTLEPKFNDFTDLCIITGPSYNKSVILDYESTLIKYMSADHTKELINSNSGIINHNYFYREIYKEEFTMLWQQLVDLGIVSHSLIDIENSNLFKYSPYKTLNMEQQKIAYDILEALNSSNNPSLKTLIEVNGGAGTGKTILAVFLIKLLVDAQQNKDIWALIEDYETAYHLKKISESFTTYKKIGFVVPMAELNSAMKDVFDSIDGLSSDMVLTPKQVVKSYYDILVVDEAHRLYKRKQLPSGSYAEFDAINKELMGDKFTKSEDDLTELDWIIKSSKQQIIFYDSLQSIRVTDIGHERFEKIIEPILYKSFELKSQMRCEGGNSYYDYMKTILFSSNLQTNKYKIVNNYVTHVANNMDELTSKIELLNKENDLCRIVAGPGWTIEENIVIDGKTYHWAKSVKSSKDIFSIHKTQGFDLNYAGVIFGRELYYDLNSRRIEIDKKYLKDNRAKANGDYEKMRDYVLNIYMVLLTRGIKGTIVYAIDSNLNNYLKKFLM